MSVNNSKENNLFTVKNQSGITFPDTTESYKDKIYIPQ